MVEARPHVSAPAAVIFIASSRARRRMLRDRTGSSRRPHRSSNEARKSLLTGSDLGDVAEATWLGNIRILRRDRGPTARRVGDIPSAPLGAQAKGFLLEDRRQPLPLEPLGHIDRLPARVLLDRLPMPILAVHDDTVVYANPAFETMLGHPVGSLGGTGAGGLVDEDISGEGSVGLVLRRRAGELLGLQHSDGSLLNVVVSQPLLLRADEQVVLIGVQDVTERIWENDDEP